MRNILIFLLPALFAGSMVFAGESESWHENFNQTVKKGNVQIPEKWAVKGTKLGVPATKFHVEKNVDSSVRKLVVSSTKSTGALMTILSGTVDLNKTPIMRWCWRVIKLAPNADGRKPGKDDQALAVYIGANGSFMTKQSLAYRWETETPKEYIGKSAYGGGLVKVKWYCLRNKKDELSKWYTETRNVADDFKTAYGYIPQNFALSIAGNSQYTGSDTLAEIKWIEFTAAEPKTPESNLLADAADKSKITDR